MQVGATRFAVSRAQGLNAASTYTSNWMEQLGREIRGAAAEMLVAKELDRHYESSVGTFHSTPDVAGWEVRSTSIEHGCLILRDNDPDDRRYVLVVGSAPDLRIAGWCLGGEGKQEWNLRNPNGDRPAWFVQQHHLRKWADR